MAKSVKKVLKVKQKVQSRKLKSKMRVVAKKSPAKKQSISKPKKVFIYALALAALGGSGYMVYDRIRKKKAGDQNRQSSNNDSDTIIINNSLPASFSSMTAKVLGSANDNFPLKRGSHGTRVLMLQQALSKTSPSILIDGLFGAQTAGALKTAGYPKVIDETLFNKITGAYKGAVQIVFNPAALAASLYRGVQSENLDQVMLVLKQLKSVSDYSVVNGYYKKQSFISKTIVTDLLEYAFNSDETAKEQIRNQFLRMGLKVNDSGNWSLQGFRLYKDLITIRETVVTDSKNNRIPVRKNTILGDELEISNGMTWFKSIDNSILSVPSQDVKYS